MQAEEPWLRPGLSSEEIRLVCAVSSLHHLLKTGVTLWNDTAAYGLFRRGRTYL